jgi:hypothetical protein
MTLLSQAVDAKKFDTRVIERNLQRGFLKPEDAQTHVQALTDDAEFAEFVSIDAIASADGKKRVPANGRTA